MLKQKKKVFCFIKSRVPFEGNAIKDLKNQIEF